jgi:hypothetical protein
MGFIHFNTYLLNGFVLFFQFYIDVLSVVVEVLSYFAYFFKLLVLVFDQFSVSLLLNGS